MTAKKKHPSLIEFYHLLAYDEVDSTNEEAQRLAAGGASHGAVIWAKRQTAGRGRMGREWISQEGNLFVSLLLQPDIELSQAPQLSFVTALAMAEALLPILEQPKQLSLKWPNDILFNDRKLGGILLETHPAEKGKFWLIAGIGVNVESSPPADGLLYPATCLKDAGIEIISAKIVLSRLLPHFVERYDDWIRDGFEPIREAWLGLAHKLNKKIAVRQGEETLSGTFAGIDESGQLMLRQKGKTVLLHSGDVLDQAV